MKPTTVIEAALFMDENHKHWAKHIDTDKLNMTNGDNCIFGQLYGHYIYGLSKYSLPYTYGDVNPFGIHAERGQWIQQIKERLAIGTFKWAVGQTHQGFKVRRKSWDKGRTLNKTMTIFELSTEDIAATNWELVPNEPKSLTLADLKNSEPFVIVYNDENPSGRTSQIFHKVQVNGAYGQYYIDSNSIVYKLHEDVVVRRLEKVPF